MDFPLDKRDSYYLDPQKHYAVCQTAGMQGLPSEDDVPKGIFICHGAQKRHHLEKIIRNLLAYLKHYGRTFEDAFRASPAEIRQPGDFCILGADDHLIKQILSKIRDGPSGPSPIQTESRLVDDASAAPAPRAAREPRAPRAYRDPRAAPAPRAPHADRAPHAASAASPVVVSLPNRKVPSLRQQRRDECALCRHNKHQIQREL